MEDKGIENLRNKIWFFLTVFLTIIMIFGLAAVYLSNRAFLYQNQQNVEMYNHDPTKEMILNHGGQPQSSESQRSRFLIKITGSSTDSYFENDLIIFESGEYGNEFNEIVEEEPDNHLVSIFANFKLDDAMALSLVEDGMNQMLYNRFRNRFLWRVPFPLVEFQGETWLMTISGMPGGDEQYFLFSNVTAITQELNAFLIALFWIGLLGFIIIIFLCKLSADFLVKPSARAARQQKQFIADASHELKTPLMIIRSNFEALKVNQEETIESQMEWLDFMEFGFNRMENLTQNLLTLSQVENPDFNLQKERFNISKTTMNVVQSLKNRVNEKNIKLITEVEPNLVINHDQELLIQVIVILLDNAIKYVNINGWIKIEVESNGNQIKFSISNSGPGISVDKLPYIFERFYRGDSSRKHGENNYGLGLSIAKGIIEKSGGKIFAKSIENEITNFTFIIG